MDIHSNPHPWGSYRADRWKQDQQAAEAYEARCRDDMWKPILASINPPAAAPSYRPIFRPANKSKSSGGGGHIALVVFLLFVLIAAVG